MIILPYNLPKATKIMVFVDGENLAIRYKNVLGQDEPQKHIQYRPDVYVWSAFINRELSHFEVIRKFYYTSATGDDDTLNQIADELKGFGIEAPFVFKKPRKDRSSKRVDLSLSTDMLLHGSRVNYDLAILITGDEDFVPVIEAVKAEGRRVVLWALRDGLSPKLRRASDYFGDIAEILFRSQDYILSH